MSDCQQRLLPPEIWREISAYLEPLELRKLALTSQSCSSGAMHALYHSPKFHPLATRDNWRDFVDRIERKTGKYDYSNYINEIDDVWCFVGGEEEAEESKDGARDSAIVLDGETEKIPKYSVAHLIQILLPKKNFKRLKLHFHSEWYPELFNQGLGYLTYLELGIRVSDGLMEQFLASKIPTHLRHLILKRAEISDASFELISELMPNLIALDIAITPISLRSRYQALMDPRTLDFVTEQGLGLVFSKCLGLRKVNIERIQVSPGVYEMLSSSSIVELSLGICQEKEMNAASISALVSRFPNLLKLKIMGSSEKGACITNTVIEEEFLFLVAKQCPKLRNLTLQCLDISRSERNCRIYYGTKNSPWELDNFRRRFVDEFQSRVALVCEFPTF